jgi:hypothetical protein
MKRNHYGDFSSMDEVLDYISDLWELYDGEGLEDAYKAFMQLPVENRTSENLDNICKSIAPADIDIYDDAEFIPRL